MCHDVSQCPYQMDRSQEDQDITKLARKVAVEKLATMIFVVYIYIRRPILNITDIMRTANWSSNSQTINQFCHDPALVSHMLF